MGKAVFTSKNTVEVNGKKLSFSKACIASGAKPFTPVYPGLENIKIYNSDNIFNLTELPEKMLIVGSGPIGSELG